MSKRPKAHKNPAQLDTTSPHAIDHDGQGYINAGEMTLHAKDCDIEPNISESTDLPYFVVPEFAELHGLPPEEERHALRVLRLGHGEEIRVTDGQGHLYAARVGSEGRSAVLYDVQLLPTAMSPIPALHLAIAPTKNMDRIEFVAEKLTEVGLATLTLVITDRTIRRQVKIDRLQKVIISAMKQSRKVHCTHLRVCSSMAEYLSLHRIQSNAFIGYCGEGFERLELAQCFGVGVASHFLIGPEGDFTPEEVASAVSAGFVPVALGQERLRTETAAIYAGMLHHIINTRAL